MSLSTNHKSDGARRVGGRGIGAIVALVAILVLAACTAFAQDPAQVGPPTADASAPPAANDDDGGATEAADSAPPPAAATSASSAASAQAWAAAGDLSSGLSPLPNNGQMPLKLS